MKLTYKGKVKDGKLLIFKRQQMLTEITGLYDGKNVTLTIDRTKSSKTQQQNAYLWGVVYEYALEGFRDKGNLGLTIDDIHEFFKTKYLDNGKTAIIPKTGEVFKMQPTTVTLLKSDMMDYITQIVMFCAEWLEVSVPDPEQQVKIPLGWTPPEDGATYDEERDKG